MTAYVIKHVVARSVPLSLLSYTYLWLTSSNYIKLDKYKSIGSIGIGEMLVESSFFFFLEMNLKEL